MPIKCNLKLPLDGDPISDVGQFQRLVGRLIYLTITRPDISYAVSLISRFMYSPRVAHMDVVNRILHYLKGSHGRGIWMRKNGHSLITAYTDADWASSTIERRSTTRYCTFVEGNLVTWRSKKQNVVARSSAKVEYRLFMNKENTLKLIVILYENKSKSRYFCTNLKESVGEERYLKDLLILDNIMAQSRFGRFP
ncbi:uncharacterized protein LOC111383174 [Olea europaea var. sylvestris]|uniref:uncharacterized protein LOC111383174 n=1 Tax=Olea europaea var. sylvestris TaxID=158386 RepID=UPI000C1D02E0|nr:uncharacterized protein LOC111383174 [Olea europaea var. sylvestris]